MGSHPQLHPEWSHHTCGRSSQFPLYIRPRRILPVLFHNYRCGVRAYQRPLHLTVNILYQRSFPSPLVLVGTRNRPLPPRLPTLPFPLPRPPQPPDPAIHRILPPTRTFFPIFPLILHLVPHELNARLQYHHHQRIIRHSHSRIDSRAGIA